MQTAALHIVVDQVVPKRFQRGAFLCADQYSARLITAGSKQILTSRSISAILTLWFVLENLILMKS